MSVGHFHVMVLGHFHVMVVSMRSGVCELIISIYWDDRGLAISICYDVWDWSFPNILVHGV